MPQIHPQKTIFIDNNSCYTNGGHGHHLSRHQKKRGGHSPQSLHLSCPLITHTEWPPRATTRQNRITVLYPPPRTRPPPPTVTCVEYKGVLPSTRHTTRCPMHHCAPWLADVWLNASFQAGVAARKESHLNATTVVVVAYGIIG